ncbi:conserved exported hypothetical protein [Mesorhizobium plurifarium]|uniref:Exopolysaccharide production repressor exox n=1 Tax=Mesorhizobium plurifarium TaxID=69974 RepID=A0A090FH35_MESPL|nr:conserved exported hypothetical protein [Mesorhizobium plurifarium]
MYFPQFLVGMVATLIAVAAWVFAATGSVWLAGGWTVAAALLLQVGYFGLIIGLTYQKPRADQPPAQAPKRQPASDRDNASKDFHGARRH